MKLCSRQIITHGMIVLLLLRCIYFSSLLYVQKLTAVVASVESILPQLMYTVKAKA